MSSLLMHTPFSEKKKRLEVDFPNVTNHFSSYKYLWVDLA